jgi:hypothetical protein
MRKFISFSLALMFLAVIVTTAQSSSTAPTVQISGVIQSFSADTLAVKPASSPAVWVTIPPDLKVDRAALKTGAQVSVEAHWADVCYVATQVTIGK